MGEAVNHPCENIIVLQWEDEEIDPDDPDDEPDSDYCARVFRGREGKPIMTEDGVKYVCTDCREDALAQGHVNGFTLVKKPKMPDVIRAVATAVRRMYPRGRNRGKCLDAATKIVERLERKHPTISVQFGFVNGKPHSWNEVFIGKRRMLLDVTADQFGKRFPAILWDDISSRPEYVYDFE